MRKTKFLRTITLSAPIVVGGTVVSGAGVVVGAGVVFIISFPGKVLHIDWLQQDASQELKKTLLSIIQNIL